MTASKKSKHQEPKQTDPVDAAFARARRVLEQLGAAHRASLEAERDFRAMCCALGMQRMPRLREYWAKFSDFELGLEALRSPESCVNEHVAFLLVATDNLNECWNGSRPCGTVDEAFTAGLGRSEPVQVQPDDDLPF